MADINDVKLGLLRSVDSLMNGGGAIAQALSEYKAALASLTMAGEGTTQSDVDAMRAQLAAIIDQLESILGITHSAKDGIEGISTRL